MLWQAHSNRLAHQKKFWSWLWDLSFITVSLTIVFSLFIFQRPLFPPDEGRYAEIAREMAESGNYITPYLDYIKYFEKPPLFYWLAALMLKYISGSVGALRSINVILAIIGCNATYITTRILYDRTTGLLSSFILGSSALYYVMTQMISLDLPLTVFISLSLYSIILYFELNIIANPQLTVGMPSSLRWDNKFGRDMRDPIVSDKLKQTKDCIGQTLHFTHPTFKPVPRYSFLLYLAAGAAAGAVLTKGLIGIIFPGLISLIWLSLTRYYQLLSLKNLIVAGIIFLSVALPWHLSAAHHNPEFAYFYFINQHFMRYLLPGIGHYQPFWFFVPWLVIGFFPWIGFLPTIISSIFKRTYQYFQNSPRLSNGHSIYLAWFWLLWISIIFGFFSLSQSKLIPYILPIFPPLSILVATHLRTINIKYYGYDIRLILICATFVLLSTYMFVIPKLETRSIRPLAQTVQALRQNEEIITYNQYYQDLAFYLNTKITILNWRNELRFGMRHQPKPTWLINYLEFWSKWFSPQRVFVIMQQEEYYRFLHVPWLVPKPISLATTETNVLISNH